MNKSDCIVIIPTYNEKENIEKIIKAVSRLKNVFIFLVLTMVHQTELRLS